MPSNLIELLPTIGSNVLILGVMGLLARHWFTNVNTELKEIKKEIKAIQIGMAKTDGRGAIIDGLKGEVDKAKEQCWKHTTQIDALFRTMDQHHLMRKRASDTEGGG